MKTALFYETLNKYWQRKRAVQARKWSRPANDPQIGQQMIPRPKMIPTKKVSQKIENWMLVFIGHNEARFLFRKPLETTANYVETNLSLATRSSLWLIKQ